MISDQCLFAVLQKPLRRLQIEEVGVGDQSETQTFKKRLETETRNVVRRDLDMFDAKFASGDNVVIDHTKAKDIRLDSSSDR